MKNQKTTDLITDALFHKGVSCPLKIYHYQVEKPPSKQLSFRQRNKLRLRDAVAMQYDNVKFTSDETDTAVLETNQWLKEDPVTICGAVINSHGCLTRIPILLKNENQLSIVQIHGKLRKQSQFKAITKVGFTRSSDIYLLKAAYRFEVLKSRFPDADVDIRFYFPKRGFKASEDNFMQRTDRKNDIDKHTRGEIRELFASMDATEGVAKVYAELPDTIVHDIFLNISLPEALKKIKHFLSYSPEQYGVNIHTGCKHCKYRINEENGCWEQFFNREDLTRPSHHVFELIGHGNNGDAENGFFYQEEVPVHKNFQSFDAVQQAGGNTITIQQRRMLQLLAAHGEKVPEIWAKPAIGIINNLQFPLHFIDFEAATYALPMNRWGGPYDPVYFQFSCHTLHKNGELTHTEWLDSNPGTGYPHQTFVRQLANINNIFEGTLVQYSPFEGQALNFLMREFHKNSMAYKNELSALEQLRYFNGRKYQSRLFDLSKLVRDSYYDIFFDGGLGLKSVLTGVLNWTKKNSSKENYRTEIYDLSIDLLSGTDTRETADPYHQIQHPDYQIDDGAEAMNAYISMKNKNLSVEETKIIPRLLKRYCALDSYAMVFIYQHLEELTKRTKGDEDLIIF